MSLWPLSAATSMGVLWRRKTFTLKYNISTIVSLNSTYGWSTLKVCQWRGWALFWMFPHLITEEHQSHIYSDSIPFKQVIGQLITYNRTTSGFEVESWGTQHSKWHHVTMSIDFQWWVWSYIHHPLTYITVIRLGHRLWSQMCAHLDAILLLQFCCTVGIF